MPSTRRCFRRSKTILPSPSLIDDPATNGGERMSQRALLLASIAVWAGFACRSPADPTTLPPAVAGASGSPGVSPKPDVPIGPIAAVGANGGSPATAPERPIPRSTEGALKPGSAK